MGNCYMYLIYCSGKVISSPPSLFPPLVAIEIFDQLESHGDPFELLSTLEPDEQNLPFRVCVGDLATEYCKYATEEAFCFQVPSCSKLQVGVVHFLFFAVLSISNIICFPF